jgi:hypothetical protein
VTPPQKVVAHRHLIADAEEAHRQAAAGDADDGQVPERPADGGAERHGAVGAHEVDHHTGTTATAQVADLLSCVAFGQDRVVGTDLGGQLRPRPTSASVGLDAPRRPPRRQPSV